MNNIETQILKLEENNDEIQINETQIENNQLTVEILSLTHTEDPSVNYYEDGNESIKTFIETIQKNIPQAKVEYEADELIIENDYDSYLARDGYIKITI